MSAKLDHRQIQEQLKQQHLKRLGRWEPTNYDFEQLARVVTAAEAWVDWEREWMLTVHNLRKWQREQRFLDQMFGIQCGE